MTAMTGQELSGFYVKELCKRLNIETQDDLDTWCDENENKLKNEFKMIMEIFIEEEFQEKKDLL